MKENETYALVAQLDRVFGYEPKGRGFESLRARHVVASYVSLATTFCKRPPGCAGGAGKALAIRRGRKTPFGKMKVRPDNCTKIPKGGHSDGE